MGIFISYNRRDGTIYPCITYERDKKRISIYTLVSCNENHWNRETQKATCGDSDYKLKNLKIQALQTRIRELREEQFQS